MVQRRSWWILSLLPCAAALGCGHTEGEWQQKLRDVDELNKKLGAEQAQAAKDKADRDEADARLAQLKQRLAAAGVDVENLEQGAAQQARALEEHRRRADQREANRRRFELLRDRLGALAGSGVEVAVRHNRVVVALPGDALFDKGRESLRKEGAELLGKVADVIRGDADLAARGWEVAGHTDDAPLAGGFRDGWALSAMRAHEVLAFLIKPAGKGGGLDGRRLSAAGYGATDPVKAGDTPEGKQKNRRCELTIVPTADELTDLRSLAPPKAAR
jgi:chemotaxis protein MotB